jgi:hypothetical protein
MAKRAKQAKQPVKKQRDLKPRRSASVKGGDSLSEKIARERDAAAIQYGTAMVAAGAAVGMGPGGAGASAGAAASAGGSGPSVVTRGTKG